VKGEFIMRRFALVIASAGLVTLTACGTTVTGRAVPAHANTVTDLSYLVASRTAAEHTVHITYDATTSIGELTKAPPADQIGALPAH